MAGESLSDAESATVFDIAAVYRERLKSLSWFIKCLNETIARMANAEDDCTGHFWEARFHSVPLWSEAAVVQAMVYVDLNPARAGMADTAGDSELTSFRARAAQESQYSQVRAAAKALYARDELMREKIKAKPLMAFADEPATHPLRRLPTGANDYCILVDDFARCAAPGKQGRMSADLKIIIERMGLNSEGWDKTASDPGR